MQSIPVIAFGTILGHGVCTFGAVMGGRYLSTKISVKHSESRAQRCAQ
jgi:putative Ca2+/H+ antiporter (TMEM165/GDT1 family)